MDYILLNKDELPQDGNLHEFQGYQYENTNISFIWVDMPPGDSVRLHNHPYQELFIIQEGEATFTIGQTTVKAHAGQIIIVPPDSPHKFTNTGEKQLKQIDIHQHPHFITEWLED